MRYSIFTYIRTYMRRLMKAFVCALKSFKITVNRTENPRNAASMCSAANTNLKV